MIGGERRIQQIVAVLRDLRNIPADTLDHVAAAAHHDRHDSKHTRDLFRAYLQAPIETYKNVYRPLQFYFHSI